MSAGRTYKVQHVTRSQLDRLVPAELCSRCELALKRAFRALVPDTDQLGRPL